MRFLQPSLFVALFVLTSLSPHPAASAFHRAVAPQWSSPFPKMALVLLTFLLIFFVSSILGQNLTLAKSFPLRVAALDLLVLLNWMASPLSTPMMGSIAIVVITITVGGDVPIACIA